MADAGVARIKSKKGKATGKSKAALTPAKAKAVKALTKSLKTAPNGKPRNAPLREVPFKVTNPERIPAQRYYDQKFYELECKYLWPRVWQMAARLEEIPQVGVWVEYRILDKSVIVIRTKSGVKAFHNACR